MLHRFRRFTTALFDSGGYAAWLMMVSAGLGFAIPGCDSSTTHSTSTKAILEPSSSATVKTQQISKVFQLRSPVVVKPTPSALDCPQFEEVARQSNLLHDYVTGSRELMLMVQPTGGGCGWLDFDRDGLWDLYLNQGGDPSASRSASQPTDQLFRNVGVGQFHNVSIAAGIDERDFSQGVTIGDFDNDGFGDIFVTNAGTNSLFRNQGDGTFRDISSSAIPQSASWNSSAAWADLDRDGDLDLYVCRYVEFDRFHPKLCYTLKGVRRMCEPNEVDSIPDEMYLNLGDGTFQPVAQERGLFGPGNSALGVAIADFDNDDWPDVYVANDATPNFLFINQRNGNFVNSADLLGCAVAAEGRAQGSMGIAVGDYDHNNYLDLYITNFESEYNTLYRNFGPGGFVDVTASAGGVELTLPMVGWGTVMEDFNRDGNEELLIANGHLDDPGHLGIDLAMKPQLFTFRALKIVDCSNRAGAFFSHNYISRGVATADYDDDGDLDAVVVNQDAPVSLLRNDSSKRHWLKLNFIGVASNRDGIGTRVTLRIGGESFMRELAGGTSYCSSNQPVLIFGLGDRSGVCDLEIRWPNGNRQAVSGIAVDQGLTFVEPRSESVSSN